MYLCFDDAFFGTKEIILRTSLSIIYLWLAKIWLVWWKKKAKKYENEKNHYQSKWMNVISNRLKSRNKSWFEIFECIKKKTLNVDNKINTTRKKNVMWHNATFNNTKRFNNNDIKIGTDWLENWIVRIKKMGRQFFFDAKWTESRHNMMKLSNLFVRRTTI